MSRMQAIVIDRDFTRDRWAPELRSTSPQPFFDEASSLFSRPAALSTVDPWVQGLWRVRDSVWAVLQSMRDQKARGAVNERSYAPRTSGVARLPVLYIAEVTDDLYRRRQNLRSSLGESKAFETELWAVPAPPSTSDLNSLSVHLFGKYPGRSFGDGETPLPQLQLEAILQSKPARRPLVWIARDLDLHDTETEHKRFLEFLLASNEVEVLRTDFEDLKEELGKRMRPTAAAAPRSARGSRESPIIHIWHAMDDPSSLRGLKQFLNDNDCGISVFHYDPLQMEKLQSRLAVCDGLVVPYTPETRTWAEDVMTEAFRLRRREERPTAFAAVELPPSTSSEFNFEHPRVIPIHVQQPGGFAPMAEFLARLEEAGA